MKNIKLIAVISVLILLLGIFLVRSCNIYDKYSELKGFHEAYKAQTETKKKEMVEINKNKEAEIKRLKTEIIEIDNLNTKIETEIVSKDKDLNKLREERKVLIAKDDIIKNLDGQISLWEKKFSLAIEERDNAFKQRDNWKLAWKEQYEITKNLEAQLLREESLRKISEDRINLCDKKLRSSRSGSTLKTAIITVMTIYGGYRLIKK